LGEKVLTLGAARTKECRIEIPITPNKRVTMLTFKASPGRNRPKSERKPVCAGMTSER
jgi:hypothetical protein